jgi:hypothetical protein
MTADSLGTMIYNNAASKMIILVDPFGNHSNRLFQAVHYEAYCLEYGHKFYDITFSDMAYYYPNAAVSRLSPKLVVVANLLSKARLTKIRRDLRNASDIERAIKFPFLLVGGWDFRVDSLTKKYQSYFIDKYSINKDLLIGVGLACKISKWRLENKIVIGVHIRRGDYKSWQNGKYFYSDSVYEHYIYLLLELIATEERQIKIVIFSNEPTSMGERLDCEVSKNQWYIDHYLMSQCHFLIGPPSTFTLWASYIGMNRYYHIKDPSSSIALSNFRYCYG